MEYLLSQRVLLSAAWVVLLVWGLFPCVTCWMCYVWWHIYCSHHPIIVLINHMSWWARWLIWYQQTEWMLTCKENSLCFHSNSCLTGRIPAAAGASSPQMIPSSTSAACVGITRGPPPTHTLSKTTLVPTLCFSTPSDGATLSVWSDRHNQEALFSCAGVGLCSA